MEGSKGIGTAEKSGFSIACSLCDVSELRIQEQDLRSCSEKSHPAKAREATHCLLYF